MFLLSSGALLSLIPQSHRRLSIFWSCQDSWHLIQSIRLFNLKSFKSFTTDGSWFHKLISQSTTGVWKLAPADLQGVEGDDFAGRTLFGKVFFSKKHTPFNIPRRSKSPPCTVCMCLFVSFTESFVWFVCPGFLVVRIIHGSLGGCYYTTFGCGTSSLELCSPPR